MAKYSTIRVRDDVYKRLDRWRLQAQVREGRDLSLGRAIALLARTRAAPLPGGVSDRAFNRALARFCPEMRGIGAEETLEMRGALAALDA